MNDHKFAKLLNHYAEFVVLSDGRKGYRIIDRGTVVDYLEKNDSNFYESKMKELTDNLKLELSQGLNDLRLPMLFNNTEKINSKNVKIFEHDKQYRDFFKL